MRLEKTENSLPASTLAWQTKVSSPGWPYVSGKQVSLNWGLTVPHNPLYYAHLCFYTQSLGVGFFFVNATKDTILLPR